jgi:integrase/recombinase XerD
LSGEGLRLYDAQGRRKYLTREERQAFLVAAEKAPRHVRTLCLTLAYTGCRISEALALTAEHIDLKAGVVVLESLKKRRKGVYRAVPCRRGKSRRSTSRTGSRRRAGRRTRAAVSAYGRGAGPLLGGASLS